MAFFRRNRRAPRVTVINVIDTANNTEDVSRDAVLKWVNDSLGTNYTKIEDLCSGEGEGKKRMGKEKVRKDGI